MIAAVVLLLLHAPGGNEIRISAAQITSMRAAKEDQENQYFTDGVRCMINLVDGKYVAVVERCEAIEKMMENAR